MTHLNWLNVLVTTEAGDDDDDDDEGATFPTSEGPGCRATEHGRLSGN